MDSCQFLVPREREEVWNTKDTKDTKEDQERRNQRSEANPGDFFPGWNKLAKKSPIEHGTAKDAKKSGRTRIFHTNF